MKRESKEKRPPLMRGDEGSVMFSYYNHSNSDDLF